MSNPTTDTTTAARDVETLRGLFMEWAFANDVPISTDNLFRAWLEGLRIGYRIANENRNAAMGDKSNPTAAT